MFKITFDATAEDPVEDLRAITRDRAEADQAILEKYRSTRVPLAFVAGTMGRDPLEAWGASVKAACLTQSVQLRQNKFL